MTTSLLQLAGLLLLATAAALIDTLLGAWVARRPAGAVLRSALAEAAHGWRRQPLVTEHPDRLGLRLAPVLYLALALGGAALVPLGLSDATATEVGVVLWGAVEAATVVAVFLHGWSPNAPLPLIGGYRYLATALPVMLLSMFVLIAAALPAASLSLAAIVEAQRDGWLLWRQPLGLPLFLLLGLSLGLRGPFNTADASDLAGGTEAEAAGAPHMLWRCARLAMLAAFSAIAATVFLGGTLGPLLPGPLWLLLKALAVLLLALAAGRWLARPPAPRLLTWLWAVLMPLGFVDLAIAGVEALR